MSLRRFVWLMFLLLDGLLMLLFVAGYAARYVHPRHLWWLQLIAIGLPYLSMIVLGATACVAVGGARKLLALHLVLCLLTFLRFFPMVRFGGSAPGATDVRQESLKVMTFNIWPKYPQVENWRATSARFQAERPHLAALQEMPTGFSATEFVDSPEGTLGDTVRYLVTMPEVSSDCVSSQVVLSRIKVDEQDQIQIEKHPDGCTYVVSVRLHWQGQEIALYTVHLRSFEYKPWGRIRTQWQDVRFWSSGLRRLKSDFLARAREAEEVAALLRKEEVPVILCGDFNSTPHNWVYRRVSRGLVDAFGAAVGRGWGATYHSKFPLVRIDFVFVSPEWHVVSAHVPRVGLSDHLPVVARLSLR